MAGVTYKWKVGARFKLDPQEAGERLEVIRVANEGRLTPDLVVEDAKKKMSPLHQLFEWNDKKAAMAHRLSQAREVIRMVAVVRVSDPEDMTVQPMRAFVRIKEPDNSYYTTVVEAMKDPEKRHQVIKRALNELLDWRRRYLTLSEFGALFDSIDRAAANLVPLGETG